MNVLDAEEVTPESTRIDGVEGVPFKLSDGRSWHLATPRLYYRPKFPTVEEPGKGVELEERWDYPHPARRKVQSLLEAVRTEETFPLMVIFAPAIELLLLCHEVAEDHAASLFDMTSEEAENLAVAMLRMFRGERIEEPENPSKES